MTTLFNDVNFHSKPGSREICLDGRKVFKNDPNAAVGILKRGLCFRMFKQWMFLRRMIKNSFSEFV